MDEMENPYAAPRNSEGPITAAPGDSPYRQSRLRLWILSTLLFLNGCAPIVMMAGLFAILLKPTQEKESFAALVAYIGGVFWCLIAWPIVACIVWYCTITVDPKPFDTILKRIAIAMFLVWLAPALWIGVLVLLG